MEKGLDYDVILFDFDGTISDSAEGIVECYRRTFAAMGMPVPEDEVLRSFVGPPQVVTFGQRYGFQGAELERIIGVFRKEYREYGLFNTVMYPGIREMLEELRGAGKTLVVATSKPEVYAKQICDEYGITGLFDMIAGSIMDVARALKAEVIEYALAELEVTDRSRVLMVGDRLYDVEGARLCGIDCMGVTYGYGSPEELLEAGARYLAATPKDVAKSILGAIKKTGS